MGYLERLFDFTIAIVEMAGPLFGFLLIILESIIPILPLAAFIALNNIAFGPVTGFLISWIATITGSCISYYIFKKGFNKYIYRYIKIDGSIHKFMRYVNHIDFAKLVLLIALPYTPAFLINIAAGLSNMSFRKFFIAILIGKISIVYFWGFVGTSIKDSFERPMILLYLSLGLGVLYLLSKLIQKALNKKGADSKWNIL